MVLGIAQGTGSHSGVIGPGVKAFLKLEYHIYTLLTRIATNIVNADLNS